MPLIRRPRAQAPRHEQTSFTARSALAEKRRVHSRPSTFPVERFIALLQTYGIESLVDIRAMPHPHHNPQFNRDSPGNALKPEERKPAIRPSKLHYCNRLGISVRARIVPMPRHTVLVLS
jgi:hypothetical protein